MTAQRPHLDEGLQPERTSLAWSRTSWSLAVTSAIFILFAVGGLIGVWNLSGTIPTLVYYGMQILSPADRKSVV